MKYIRQQIVYSEGEHVEFFYIVLKGEFESTRKLKRSEQSISL